MTPPITDSPDPAGPPDPSGSWAQWLVSGVSAVRRRNGLIVALLGAPLLTLALLPVRPHVSLETALLLFVLVSVVASAIGGVVPAAVAAVWSFGWANFFFTPPYGSFLVQHDSQLLALTVFVAVAALMGLVTEMGARARASEERARLEARLVTKLGNESGAGSLQRALEDARLLFGMDAALLTDGSEVLSQAGVIKPEDVELTVPAGEGLILQLHGPQLLGQDRRLLNMLALAAGRLWRTEQLAAQARRAEELARIDQLRSSLLAAVGHDLRNPLAAVTAAVGTLRQDDIELSPPEQQELLATIESNAIRLSDLIANLLDMSRIQAHALSVNLRPTEVVEVLASALRLGEGGLKLDLPEDLPMVSADAGLLERVLANLVDNAERFQPGDHALLIRARAMGGKVVVQVVDQGQGVSSERFGELFAPFQRFDDRSGAGVGLGLAIAKGFTEAMGGRLTPSATPGGGLTMTVELDIAELEIAHGAPAHS